jgi:hypothetical protein
MLCLSYQAHQSEWTSLLRIWPVADDLLQCDKDKPECSQCKRMRMVCPGYPDHSKQAFRDETVKVTRKAQQSYMEKVSQSKDSRDSVSLSTVSPVPGELPASLPLDLNDTPMAPLQLRLVPPLEDVALAHFMTSYVPGSRFGYLLGMYATLGPDVSLPAAIDAASKARLAWEFEEPKMMEAARISYAKALTLTNLALSNPATALQDTTLVSVLLLSLFETMIWAGTGIPDNWTTHTHGALTLVRLRGKPQLETQVGRQLFTHVTNIVSVTSIRLRQRVPQEVVELQTEVLRHNDGLRPLYLVTCHTSETANLLAEVAEGNMSVNEIIESVRTMDEKYVSFLENLEPIWGYRNIVLDKDDSDTYGRLIHEYAQPRTALIWNSARMTRIMLNEIIHGHASLISTPYADVIKAQAQRNAELMATDICATVSHFLNPNTFNAAYAITLLWPLSAVRGAHLAPQDLREYAAQTLKRLGCRLRMPGAEKGVVFDPKTSRSEPLHDGLHMFYLA